MTRTTLELHPDHDLAARRKAMWDRHHAQMARVAASNRTAGPPPPFWRPSKEALANQRATSVSVEREMAAASDGAGVDLLDAMARAWHALGAGDVARARDHLERSLDETYPDWKVRCPW